MIGSLLATSVSKVQDKDSSEWMNSCCFDKAAFLLYRNSFLHTIQLVSPPTPSLPITAVKLGPAVVKPLPSPPPTCTPAMSTSPKRLTSRVSSSTLPRSRTSSGTLNRKDLSNDEGSALNDMQKRVSVCVWVWMWEGGREGGVRGCGSK